MTGCDQAFDWAAGARAGIHMAVAAFQPCVRVGAMGEAIAAFFVAIAAQRRDRFSLGGLGVRVMTVFAHNAFTTMHAGTPLIGGLLVASGAKLGIWGNRHDLLWVTRLERAVTGFATDPGFGIFSGCRIIAGRVAFQAGDIGSLSSPVALENGGGDCLRMPGDRPDVNDICMAFPARLGASVTGCLGQYCPHRYRAGS